jgi:hypothetical protein
MIRTLPVGVIAVLLLSVAVPARAQLIEIQPPSISIGPPRQYEEPRPVPPPVERRAVRRDRWEIMREEMIGYRARCEEGDRRACVRLGILIGENRDRRAEWRTHNPEFFFWER